jgi:hypothetical protein
VRLAFGDGNRPQGRDLDFSDHAVSLAPTSTAPERLVEGLDRRWQAARSCRRSNPGRSGSGSARPGHFRAGQHRRPFWRSISAVCREPNARTR